ncbi:hypothetical protein BDP27DRAFT_210424 [Rhodocollybia butyracea]|uniref:Protein kinase domain-containing protein n=1 Tax=Rhodocollybia butyracea TaxID=206335 RepID=A0A9P5PDY3_9AGAR|nr:hypothetical protein BDP27DRAFT_210424 [Rhodocollybia butyracea]
MKQVPPQFAYVSEVKALEKRKLLLDCGTLQGSGHNDHTWALIMPEISETPLVEYLEGKNIDEVAKKLIPQLKEKVVDMIMNDGMIYYDLNSGNIMTNGDTVSLVDFGLVLRPKAGIQQDTLKKQAEEYFDGIAKIMTNIWKSP